MGSHPNQSNPMSGAGVFFFHLLTRICVEFRLFALKGVDFTGWKYVLILFRGLKQMEVFSLGVFQ